MSDLELNKPHFVDYNESNQAIRVYCKVCGATIADTVRGHFHRFKNYAEMKMRFSNGSYHVTSGCNKCISLAIKDEDLRLAMHQADIDDMIREVPELASYRTRSDPKVVKVDFSRRGIP